MSAATARRVEALRARAEHQATPEAEAAACRELLTKLVPECGCTFCALVAADPWAEARWEAIREDPAVRILCCGMWITSTT